MTIKRLAVALLLLSLAACGGGHRATRTGAVVSPAPLASSASSPMSVSSPTQSQRGAAASGTLAPMPTSMDCGGSQPVWVNERSHVWHLAGTPYYGHTKHGKYMCETDAAKAGYHSSKT